jgi:hypothetical protein
MHYDLAQISQKAEQIQATPLARAVAGLIAERVDEG